ncbi:MAG: phosphoribosylamine--glycine ligase, partial [Candidatus Thermoplasmatota archaeon]|nr:phosphoribosylamine--glycine ligase [Candidatus Thermoplasmatota archaeon]
MATNVLVIGSGGREHALCAGLVSSPTIGSLFCSPGNAGTASIATNVKLDIGNHDSVIEYCKNHEISLVVVGPEAPLCDGISDSLMAAGINSFGPESYLANLEGSKAFAKEIMVKAGVPTARVERLQKGSDINKTLDEFSANPWVIKRDVLAGGKGVVVTTDRQEAIDFIQFSIESDGYVLLESFLSGEEASMLVVMDKNSFLCLPASQDHKRVGNGDTGPNTGGMGAYCPAPVVTEDVFSKVENRIVKPMHDFFSTLDVPYRGVLYVGLMIDENGDPSVVEFNVRFGDPECQVTIPIIKANLVELFTAACEDKLDSVEVDFHDQS